MAQNQQPLCWKRTVAFSWDAHKSHDRFKTGKQHFHYKYCNVSRILKNIQVLSRTFFFLFKGTSVATWFPAAQLSSCFHWFSCTTIFGIKPFRTPHKMFPGLSDIIKNAIDPVRDLPVAASPWKKKKHGIWQFFKAACCKVSEQFAVMKFANLLKCHI